MWGAFTWCGLTHDFSQAVAHSAHWQHISYHLTYGLELTGLKFCWLFCLEYHARESVPDTHSKYQWVETLASSGVGGAGAQTYRCSCWTVATPSQCVWLVWKLKGDILNNICIEFTCSSSVCVLNSKPMYLTFSFATHWFCVFCVIWQQILCILCRMRFQFILLPNKQSFANICYSVSCINYSWTKCYKNCNISTDGDSVSKRHGVYVHRESKGRHHTLFFTKYWWFSKFVYWYTVHKISSEVIIISSIKSEDIYVTLKW